MVNREHMEQWINALEAYDREPARSVLRDPDGNMCAVGIGLHAMNPLIFSTKWITGTGPGHLDFSTWLGLPGGVFNLLLNPDDTGTCTILEANDYAHQSPWTIAQRLRETYLKEES